MSYFKVDFNTIIKMYGHCFKQQGKENDVIKVDANKLLDFKNLFLSINKDLEIHTYDSENILVDNSLRVAEKYGLESLKNKRKLFLRNIYIIPKVKNFGLKDFNINDINKEFEILSFKKGENRELILFFTHWHKEETCFYSQTYRQIFKDVNNYLQTILREEFKEEKNIEKSTFSYFSPYKQLLWNVYHPETFATKTLLYVRWNNNDLMEKNLNEKEYINLKIKQMLDNENAFRVFDYELHLGGVLI